MGSPVRIPTSLAPRHSGTALGSKLGGHMNRRTYWLAAGLVSLGAIVAATIWVVPPRGSGDNQKIRRLAYRVTWGERFRSIEGVVPSRLSKPFHFDEYRFNTALEVRDLTGSGYLTGVFVDISKLPHNPTNQATALDEAKRQLQKGELLDFCWVQSVRNNRVCVTCRTSDAAAVKRALNSDL